MAINCGGRVIRNLLNCEGRIPSLEILTLYDGQFLPSPGMELSDICPRIPDDDSLEFLKKNPQLKTFVLQGPATPTLLERISSVLATFPEFDKVSIVWRGDHIPDSSLNALSSISTLTSLHLSAGSQVSTVNWRPRHDDIISHLEPLRRLKQIIITRDIYSYSTPLGIIEYENYTKLPSEVWDMHRCDMHAWALKYAKTFSNLEVIYIGRILLKVCRADSSLEVEIIEDTFEDGIFTADFAWVPEQIRRFA